MVFFFWFSVLAVLESIQATALLYWVLRFIKPPAPLSGSVLPEWQYLLHPEWEAVVFRFFVLMCMALMAVFVWQGHNRSGDGEFVSRLKYFIALESVLVFFLLAALFKNMVYSERPDSANTAVGILALVLVLSKGIGFRFKGIVRGMDHFFNDSANQPHLRRLFDIGMIGLIILIFYMPDPQAVVARMFVGEQFHHNDSFIMGPGWAYTAGRVLNVEIISQYGLGFPVVMSLLTKIIGGFNYLNVLVVMVGVTILYYGAWYWILRRWLSSIVLAAAVLLLGIKWQMFHSSAYPLVFTYGSQTPVRFLYDIFYFLLLWRFLDSRRTVFLLAASAVAGFGIYYLTSEGLYALASLYGCLLICTVAKPLRLIYAFKIPHLVAAVLLPPLVFLLFIFLTVGGHVFDPAFWNNMGEFIQYFIGGFGLEPMYKTLLERQFLQSLMGFLIPAVYVITLLVTGTLAFFGRASKKDLFALVLCLYGLGTFHYYVARSVVTSYDTVALPFTFILGFWVMKLSEVWPKRQAEYMGLALLAVALYALGTNHLFMSYPNLLNLSRNPVTDPKVALPLENGKPYFNHLFRDYPEEQKLPANSLGQHNEDIVSESNFSSDDDLVRYYTQASDFSIDAALIDRLTVGDQEVPLISSFEIPILMQANRRPYFYYFPLVISRPMTMRMFTATSVYTKDQMKKVLDKLEEDKPPQVFIERIFLNDQVPKTYFAQYPTLLILLDYLRSHYEAGPTGQYLVALKRK